jgi:hypothetical protein
MLIPMDWLILILGLPAILIPLVLLFGFAGCVPAAVCTDDRDCPPGTRCAADGSCVPVGDANLPPAAPQNLAAIALSDHSVSLTWTNAEPAADGFRFERTQEAGDPEEITPRLNPSSTGATDESGLQEGVTYIYRVRALLGEEASNESFATVFPAAPVNLVATPAGIDQIDLSWNNASTIATDFSVERRGSTGFAEIARVAGTTFSDAGLGEGVQHDYRVFAVIDGFEDSQRQPVIKSAAASASARTLAFTAAFTAPPGLLSTDQAGDEGFCLVQRLNSALLTASGTQVRMVLRGSTAGDLRLDRVTISQPAVATTAADPYDSGTDLTDVAAGVQIAANTAVTVGPVAYALDRTKDLIIAFDISNAQNEGNVRFGALTGADAFARPATAEAGVQDRTTGYPDIGADTLFLIEKIDVA